MTYRKDLEKRPSRSDGMGMVSQGLKSGIRRREKVDVVEEPTGVGQNTEICCK